MEEHKKLKLRDKCSLMAREKAGLGLDNFTTNANEAMNSVLSTNCKQSLEEAIALLQKEAIIVFVFFVIFEIRYPSPLEKGGGSNCGSKNNLAYFKVVYETAAF